MEVKIKIIARDQQELANVITALSALNGTEVKMDSVSTVTGKSKVEKPKVEKPKAEPVKKESKVEESKDAPKVTDQQIRKLISEKIEKNRDSIKAKLTELGANNVSSLKEEHYSTMVEFLEGLK